MLYLSAAVGAFAVHQLGFGEKGFTGGTVHTLIVALVDIALIIELFEYFLNLGFVIRIGGADEFVVGGVQRSVFARGRRTEVVTREYTRLL